MKNYKIIQVKESIFKNNDENAKLLREKLKKEKKFFLNLMSSPGSGKTTTLVRTIKELKGKYKIGIMEADIDSDVDTKTVVEAGAKAIQLHTGGMCHLDAEMVKQGLEELGTDKMDLIVLENVGNLVCPAEFDTGASKSAMILSVPEGDDKPLKYPLIFSVVDVVLVNKVDTISMFDFDIEKFKKRVEAINPNIEVICFSAKTGEGFSPWISWLESNVKEWRS